MIEAPPTVTVRLGNAQDLPQLGALWQQLMEYHARLDPRYKTAPGGREAFLRYVSANVLRSRDNLLLVAEVGGKLAGFLIARMEYGGGIFADPNFGYITDACVSERYRRMGIGRRLFESAKQWFRQRGLKNVRVSVSSENPLSQDFWRDLGFRPFMERWWYDL